MVSLNVIREPDKFCQPCGLYKLCKTPVMNGEGSSHPIWLFIGEAPGGEEDDEGYPFAGESGSELRQGIEDVAIPIDKCRFTNVVRCRPPENNLKKYPDAIDHCRPHILREIRATQPKVVILVGNSAIKSILNKTGILKLHGQVIDVGEMKYVCMFHPAYLLRNNTPKTRRLFYEALKTAKRAATSKSIAVKSDRKHIIIKDRQMLKEAVDAIKKSEYPATDIEASTLSPFSRKRTPKVSVVGVATENDLAFAFPIDERVGLQGCKMKKEEVLEGLKEVWEDSNLKWLAWHGKYDQGYMGVLHKIWLGGSRLSHPYWDGMLGSYALDERKGIHGLKDWSYRVGMSGYDQLKSQYQMMHPETDPERGGNINLIPAEILYPYNLDDCICTRRCFFLQRKKLKKKGLWDRPFKFPLMWISWIAMAMEITGMNASKERNRELDVLYRKRIEKIDEKLYSYPEVKELQRRADEKLLEELYERVTSYKRPVPNVKKRVLELFKNNTEPINLNSPDVKRDLIFDVMDYEAIAETETGLPSAERWVLEELYRQQKHPILKNIIDRGRFSSAQSKYITPVEGWIGSDGRVHGSHLPHGTETGRLSSQDPNLYNLPARSVLTAELISQFVPRKKDFVIVKQDSKQIELRLIADRAQDETMIEEFNDGKDPHAMGAQAAFEKTEEEWAALPKEKAKELRGYCKNAVSFGLVYGREAEALAADFGWRLSRAEDFKEKYFSKYHGIRDYLDDERERILEKGLVISHYNRHRHLPDAFNNEEIGKQNKAVREGINSPIQGDASDINIIAAYRMARWLIRRGMKTRVFLYVYDAVYMDSYVPELSITIPKLREFMTDRGFLKKMVGWKLGVPLDTDCAIYKSNMGDGIELERDKRGDFVIPKI